MSRLFCLTRRMSDEMMLSAPTITMRPIVIEIAIFSSQSAEKSDRLSSDQSSADVLRTEPLGNRLAPHRPPPRCRSTRS